MAGWSTSAGAHIESDTMRCSLALFAAVKKTTGLTGLAVDPKATTNYTNVLLRLKRDILTIPESAAYRVVLEKTVAERLAIVKAATSVEEIETKIGAGQIEELIIQAKKELDIIPVVKKYQVWQDLEVQPPKDQWKYPGRK